MGQSLIETAKKFGTEEQCLAYLEAMRWSDGLRCLKCGSDKVSKFVTNETTRERTNRKGETVDVRVPARRLYQCNNEGCRYQYSATTGTIFDKSHLPLSKWFLAVALITNAKKGLSAKQMQRDLGVNYRTAWFLDHRIREAMQDGTLGLFDGTVEVDATFIGGKYDDRRKRAKYDKQAVAGVLQRSSEDGHSKVKAFPVEREIVPVMTGVIRDHISLEASIMTDEHGAYRGLNKLGRKHEIVRHTSNEYVRGNVHTNSIENFWSLFKRGLIGSFHQVSVKHLHRYLNEFSFRFNAREAEDMFSMIIMNLAIGSALRYKTLIGKTSEPLATQEPL
jgi:transposase-like protein